MSVAGEVTYARRFAVKFVEIVAAGIGTAVSGYLIAYVTGHLSWSTVAEHLSFSKRAAVEATSPQAVSSPAEPSPTEPRKTASIEATVRAALASHDVSEAAPPAFTPLPPVPASSAAPSATTVAPPLDAAEIKSLPVTAAAEPPLPAELDGWPTDPTATSGAGRLLAAGSLRRLPPQPPPANGNLLTALRHFF